MSTLISLDQAIQDKSYDADIIDRFLKIYTIPREDAAALLKAVKQFLWISQKRRQEEGKMTPIIFEQFAMDEMWHNFILFTRQYHAYCQECYGDYLHHTPATSNEPEQTPQEFEHNLRENLLYIEKYLGLEVVNLWYVDWPERLSKKVLLSTLVTSAGIPGREFLDGS